MAVICVREHWGLNVCVCVCVCMYVCVNNVYAPWGCGVLGGRHVLACVRTGVNSNDNVCAQHKFERQCVCAQLYTLCGVGLGDFMVRSHSHGVSEYYADQCIRIIHAHTY